MIKKTHTRAKPLRIPDEDWDELKKNAGPRNGTAVVVALIRWYNRKPGYDLPDRPPKQEKPDGD